ncbi:hypothetical protein BU16DRAFT_620643 [Lophium mytilinum]|uniref:Uncharacterized protein n=1 Tax=Lophium mytilinum TaxID=390894 RepID=A0A6A6QIK5_9PEZI|nr:hypothetical protein BU16DRAFT_620643 [Lophium mytilinum]
MSSAHSCIDDGAAFTGRLRPGHRPASLYQVAIRNAHDLNNAEPSPITKVDRWVHAIDDGPLSPVDNRPGRSKTTPRFVNRNLGSEAGTDLLSYIDDGGEIMAQDQKVHAAQATTQRRYSAPPLVRPSLTALRIPKVQPTTPQISKDQSKWTRPRNVSQVHYPEVEKAALQDIRSTIRNIESLAATVVAARAPKSIRSIRTITPPSLPTFIIKASNRDASVVVDGRGAPIRERSSSRRSSGSDRMPNDEAIELPEYPVFANKVRPVPKAAKIKSRKEHQEGNDFGLGDWDAEPKNEGYHGGNDTGQRNQKENKKGKKQQGQANLKQQASKKPASSSWAEKKDNDGDAWGGNFENDDDGLVISPDISPPPSDADVWMSGGLGIPSPPASVTGKESAKKKQSESQKGKGKGTLSAGAKKSTGGGKKEKKGKQGKQSNQNRLDTILEAVENDAKAKTADDSTLWANAGAASMQAGDTYMPWPTISQQQTGMAMQMAPPDVPPQPFAYGYGFPVPVGALPTGIPTPDANASIPNPDAEDQNPSQSNYKAPTVETVSSSPSKGKTTPVQGSQGSPRTPGGRRKNGYDDDEGYTNAVWGGIPVRVAEWRLSKP